MKTKVLSFLTLFFIFAGTFQTALAKDEQLLPAQMLERMDSILRGSSHDMTVKMDIKTKSWKRNYTFQVWMKGIDKGFARVLGPAKVKGQGFLRLESRLWNFIPTAEKTILIPPSLMLDRFMGSDFSNDDFVKMSYLPRDYIAQIQGRELIVDTEAYVLLLTPKKDAPVTYGRLKVLLRKEDYAPVRIEFYNEKLEHIRTLFYSEYKDFGGHVVPTVWRMSNLREKDRETTITVQDAKFDVEIPDSVFTQGNLEKNS